jgi:hypothetical protein
LKKPMFKENIASIFREEQAKKDNIVKSVESLAIGCLEL